MSKGLRSPAGRRLVPLEHDLVARFVTRRGSFIIPAEVLDDDERVAYLIASQTPEGASLTRRPHAGGVAYHWHVTRVVIERA